MKIDWKKLANQRATLCDLVENGILTPQQVEDLAGVVDFIKDRQIESILKSGGNEDVLYLREDGYYNSDGDKVAPSEWTPGPDWRTMMYKVTPQELNAYINGTKTV